MPDDLLSVPLLPVTQDRRETPITDEFVERLRRDGASADLVAFTDRHVARFSQADLDRVMWRAFWIGVGLAVAVWAAVSWALR